MVRHVIVWSFKDELSAEEKAAAAKKIKTELEALVGVVPGLKELTVITNPMDSSNVDLMLDSTIDTPENYDVYKVHPAHVAAATYVRSVVQSRSCMDYEF
ncbi:MAG: Dabb family protein [Clostridia bacterium]|nr:Dabb family protein [Clostridia bacterium]